MRVVSVGTKHHVKCGHCGSVLAPDPSDIKLRYAPVAAGPWEVECMPEGADHFKAEVTCTVCNRPVSVEVPRAQKKLPAYPSFADDPTY